MKPVSLQENRPRLSPLLSPGARLLFLLLLCLAPHLRAEQFGDFTYQVDGGSVTITGYTGEGGEVTIPAVINDPPVTKISGASFRNLNQREPFSTEGARRSKPTHRESPLLCSSGIAEPPETFPPR